MCGRFAFYPNDPVSVQAQFQLASTPTINPSYNITPSQSVPVIRTKDEQRILDYLRWGLIPSWAKDEKIGYKLINARAETVHEKPSFRSAFKSRRCLVLASGYFEWQQAGEGKQPYYISSTDDQVLGFAGIWEQWTNKETGEFIETCSIVTTEAVQPLDKIHHRMPVIIDKKDYEHWLSSEETKMEAVDSHYEYRTLANHPVSKAVNNPRNNDPSVIAIPH